MDPARGASPDEQKWIEMQLSATNQLIDAVPELERFFRRLRTDEARTKGWEVITSLPSFCSAAGRTYKAKGFEAVVFGTKSKYWK